MKEAYNINNGAFSDPELKNNPLKRFFRMLALDKADLARVYIFAIFSGIINLSIPVTIQAIIGQIMSMQFSTSLFVLIFVVSIAVLFSGAFQLMQFRIIEEIQRRIFTRTSFEFAFKIPQIKIERVVAIYPPELINRFFDIKTIEKGLPKIILDFSTSIVSIIMGLVLLTIYHPVFIMFGVLLVLFVYILLKLTGQKGLETKMEQSTYKYKVVHWLQEIGRSLLAFKLIPNPNIGIFNTDKIVSNYLDARKKHFNVLITQYSTVIIFKTLLITGLLLLGALLVIKQQLNLGQFVAVEIMIFIIVVSVEKLILTLESVYDVLVGMEKISHVLSIPVETINEAHLGFEPGQGGLSIELDNLSYGAFKNQQKALEDINLTIAKGEKVCIAGGNGSGKSTLVHLLSGIYSEFNGSICYNEIPLSNYSPFDLRQIIGCCFTDDDIFTGTIRENIAMGQPFTTARLMEVVNKLGLKNFIQSLPEGFDTILIPENRAYPKTFIQKIVLARNILKEPKLMLLDNFLTLFSITEKNRILDYLLSHENNWTLVIISNEVEIINKCQRLIVLEKGNIKVNSEVRMALKDKNVLEILSSI